VAGECFPDIHRLDRLTDTAAAARGSRSGNRRARPHVPL
jgi:hypothetical protein